jgi:uncharacterized repeat protein (TIGR03803 family)
MPTVCEREAMFGKRYSVSNIHFACGIALSLLATIDSADSKEGFAVLYAFKGGSDGNGSRAGLIADQAGNLYGTTSSGGAMSCPGSEGAGCGTVFRFAPDGTKTVLYAFTGGSDGAYPFASLTADQAGNLYGTTYEGGGSVCNGNGCGTVFKISTDGTETVLHAFGYGDGTHPEARLLTDQAGNLYGTTADGGGGCCGTVFELAPNGVETVLFAFTKKKGKNPVAGLITDQSGNLYGTTSYGGGGGACEGLAKCGTVFKLTPNGKLIVLHAFVGGTDGAVPLADLITDQAGNLYGTTFEGGGFYDCPAGYGCGTVFELSPNGTETVLHSFGGGNDGANPRAGLVADHAGNLYGTTAVGGTYGYGAVFKLAPDGTTKVLHTFRGGRDGSAPSANLTLDQADNLYGTTFEGGNRKCTANHGYCGVIFKLAK